MPGDRDKSDHRQVLQIRKSGSNSQYGQGTGSDDTQRAGFCQQAFVPHPPFFPGQAGGVALRAGAGGRTFQ